MLAEDDGVDALTREQMEDIVSRRTTEALSALQQQVEAIMAHSMRLEALLAAQHIQNTALQQGAARHQPHSFTAGAAAGATGSHYAASHAPHQQAPAPRSQPYSHQAQQRAAVGPAAAGSPSSSTRSSSPSSSVSKTSSRQLHNQGRANGAAADSTTNITPFKDT